MSEIAKVIDGHRYAVRVVKGQEWGKPVTYRRAYMALDICPGDEAALSDIAVVGHAPAPTADAVHEIYQQSESASMSVLTHYVQHFLEASEGVSFSNMSLYGRINKLRGKAKREPAP